MSGHGRLTDAEIEALLSGTSPEGLESIGDLISEIRSLGAGSVDPQVAERHVAAAAAIARSAATAGATAPKGRRASAGTRTRRRKRTVFAGITSTIAGKILAGTVAAAAATGTAAAAGVLPDSIQEVFDDNVIVVEEIQEMKHLRDQDRLHLEDPAADPAEVQTHERDQNQTNQGTQNGQGDEGAQNQYGNTDDQPGQQGDDPAQHQNGQGDGDAIPQQQGQGYAGDGTQTQQGQSDDGPGSGNANTEQGQGGSEQDRGRG